MQITVTIPDELAVEAKARGLSLDRHLADLLAEDLASSQPDCQPVPNRSFGRAGGERRNAAVDFMMGFALEHGFTTSGQDLKSMTREGHPY